MTCREITDSLCDYVDGEMPAPARRALEQHLAGCPDCPVFLVQYQRTIEVCRLACRGSTCDVDERFIAAVVRMVAALAR